MTCKECYLCYKDEGDAWPSCHYTGSTCWDVPPCEQEDIDRFNELDEMEYQAELDQIQRESDH